MDSLAARRRKSRYDSAVVVNTVHREQVMKIGVIVSIVLLAMTGCSQSIHDSKDYYRHSLSQLSTPRDGGGFFWFDVKLTPEWPDNNETAEAKRMEWLEGWLEVRKACGNGYEIIERRKFDFLEHNPAQYDLRYKVQCKVGPPPGEA